MADMQARVEQLVDTVFEVSIDSCETPRTGRMAQTYLLDLDDYPHRAVCKIGGPSVRTGDVVEPLVLELVEGTPDVPTPEVLARGTFQRESRTEAATQREAETHWAFYEFCEGALPTPFQSIGGEIRHEVVRDVGRMLGSLHETHQFERIGGLGRRGQDLEIRAPDGLHIPERGRQLVRTLPGHTGSTWQPVLSHGDLFPDNVLVEGDTVSAYLDWGNAHITTAGYALARAEMRFVDWFRFEAAERRRLREALREGYRSHRAVPPDYESLGTFYKLLWLGQSAERLSRHLRNQRGRAQLRRHFNSLLPDTE